MNSAISAMLEKYDCQSQLDYENALHEIIQEIALLGLWRSKFFEHAAFYGGTALRILYGLDRFSEDLDFSLLAPNTSFSLNTYNDAVARELQSFGLDVSISEKRKTESAIQSAFIKANTKQQLISIEASSSLINQIHRDRSIKIKMEIDTDPPMGFDTEAKPLLMPIPFSVNTYTKPSLFAGKLHAILCRNWKERVKGRDWYDLIWYIGNRVQPNLPHLQQRLSQTGHWDESKGELTQEKLKALLIERIESIDFQRAREDVQRFVIDADALSLWSTAFFKDVVNGYF